jgi:phosphate transport system substrate-binding protein
MNKAVSYFLIIIFIFIATPAVAKDLSWTGCGITKHAFMNEIADAFEKKTGMKIRLSGGGATKGIRSVSARTVDMGGSCRIWIVLPSGVIHPHEINAKLVHVGWDALVPIVNQDNPLKNISIKTIKQILDGEVKNWADLGWSDSGKIILCTRESNISGVGFMARKIFFDDVSYKLKGRSLLFKSSTSLEQKIETSTRSFGLTGISSAKRRDLKILLVDGVYPSKENIASGNFPLFRPLFITVSKSAIRPEVKKFIDFIKGPEGQEIMSTQGTVNLEEGKMLTSLWQAKFPGFKIP